MSRDAIIDEVRAIRDAIARVHNYSWMISRRSVPRLVREVRGTVGGKRLAGWPNRIYLFRRFAVLPFFRDPAEERPERRSHLTAVGRARRGSMSV